MTKNIGFVSTRFSGTDGVSLESSKWADVNYQIAARHYSYSVLRSQLTAAIRMFFGDSVEPLTANASDSENEEFLYIDPQAVMYKRYDSQDCRVS